MGGIPALSFPANDETFRMFVTKDLFAGTSRVGLCGCKSHCDGGAFDARHYFVEQLKDLPALAGVQNIGRDIDSQEDRLSELLELSSERRRTLDMGRTAS